MRSASRPWLMGLFCGLLLCPVAGCYKYVAIRPDQLPRLNGSYAVVTGRHSVGNSIVNSVAGEQYHGNTVVTAGVQTVTHVLTPDGRTVQVVGEFSARIRGTQGQEVTFEHPVMSEVQGWNLVVRGSNRPQTQIPMDSIHSVEVSQLDQGAMIAAVIGGGLGGGLVLGLLTYALISGI